MSQKNIRPKESGAETKEELHLFDHLAELRTRLLHSVLAVMLLSVIAYLWIQDVMHFFTAPFFSAFPPESLIGTGPAEAFMLKLKVAVFAGLVLASPYIFYQIWLFVRPGLYQQERRLLLPFVGLTSLLFLIGVAFAYFWVLPFVLQFFLAEYQSVNVNPAIKLGEHLALVIQLLLCFGLIFEWPVLAFLLGRLRLIQEDTLVKYWRHAVVAIFIIAAFLTPPDVLSQLMMAGPLLVLYAISLPIVKFTCKKT